MKPLAIDLFCGLGGWTEGLLAEGYEVVGFDIEGFSRFLLTLNTPATVRLWAEAGRIDGATKAKGRSARWRFPRRSLLSRRIH